MSLRWRAPYSLTGESVSGEKQPYLGLQGAGLHLEFAFPACTRKVCELLNSWRKLALLNLWANR
jgi:hypothetical protein